MFWQYLFGIGPYIMSIMTGLCVMYRTGNHPKGDPFTFILFGVAVGFFLMQWYMMGYLHHFYYK